MVEET
jgi:hypothetical protein